MNFESKRLEVILPMAMDFMTWQATFGSGVRIGMILIIIANHPCVILKDPVHPVTVCCVGGLGTTVRTSCMLLAASETSALLILGSSTTDFAVWQDRNKV